MGATWAKLVQVWSRISANSSQKQTKFAASPKSWWPLLRTGVYRYCFNDDLFIHLLLLIIHHIIGLYKKSNAYFSSWTNYFNSFLHVICSLTLTEDYSSADLTKASHLHWTKTTWRTASTPLRTSCLLCQRMLNWLLMQKPGHLCLLALHLKSGELCLQGN